MLTPERITALPTAEELEEGYYVLIDSPTLGTRKIAVENFIPPADHDLYRWDFTKAVNPLVDEVNGAIATLNNNCEIEAGKGITTKNHGGFVQLISDFSLFNKTIELDISNITFGSQLNLLSKDNGNYINSFRFRYQRYHVPPSYYATMINNTEQPYTTTTDVEIPNGKTAKIIYGNDNTDMKMFVDDVLYYSGYGFEETGSSFVFGIGSRSNSLDMTITGVRIYENEEV